MASSVITGILAATMLVLLSTSAHGQENRHGVIGGYGGNGGYRGLGIPPRPCYVDPREIECVNFNLELLLRLAVIDYIKGNPSITSSAPWFDAFKHIDTSPGSTDDLSLRLLSNEDIRESIIYCVVSYDNKTVVPTSPTQMYDDLCTENYRIWSEDK